MPGLVWTTLVVVAFWGPFWPANVPATFAGLGSLAAGTGLALIAWWLGRNRLTTVPYIPPGDVFWLLTRLRLDPPVLSWRGFAGPGLKSRLTVPEVSHGERAALLGPGLYLFAVMSLLLGALWLPL
jgi:hypothetical protein